MKSRDLTHESIRGFMDLPRAKRGVNEVVWHEQAPAVFVDQNEDFGKTLIRQNNEFLQTYPYDSLRDLLEDTTIDQSHEVLSELRFMRKTIMIGRDVIKLCATKESGADTELYSTLSLLSTTLGLIIEDTEQNRRQSTSIQTTAAQELTGKLQLDSKNSPLLIPVSSRKILHRTKRALLTEELMRELDTSDEAIDEEYFHKARRLFRSVGHLGIASQIIFPNAEKKRFAKVGIKLNAKYGAAHDRLLSNES